MCRPALARLLLLQLLLLKLHLGKGGVGAAPGGEHASAGLPQGMGVEGRGSSAGSAARRGLRRRERGPCTLVSGECNAAAADGSCHL